MEADCHQEARFNTGSSQYGNVSMKPKEGGEGGGNPCIWELTPLEGAKPHQVEFHTVKECCK